MARGRWLKKMAKQARDRFEDVQELVDSNGAAGKASGTSSSSSSSLVTNLVSSALSGDATAALANMDLGPAVSSVRARGTECATVAQETMDLCVTTQSKSQQMVDFASEIQSTLSDFSTGMDASALETIKNLTDGAKLNQAMEIAKDMDVIALGCVDKSVQMIDIMEDAMDDLPDALEEWIVKAADDQEDVEDDAASLTMKSLDKDVEDIQACIDAMQELNIGTALQVGLRAFEQLSAKAQTSRAMFDSIQGFSTSVRDITQDFADLDVMSLSSKIKDILKCIQLSEVMRAFAEGTKKIIQVLINLFKATSDKISSLWTALVFAKDCMSDCVEQVFQANTLILEAHDKSRSLLEHTDSVLGQLSSVKKMNRQTFQSVRALSQGDEIPNAIALARGMDDLIVECTSKVTIMVDRVSEGFQNLPDIITKGFGDMEQEGKDDTDPQPTGVDEDIAELEASREAVEGSDIFTACKSGASGFTSVSKKTELCTEMLVNVQEFATSCDGTIESFMGVWDLESAIVKIKEMCRLVSVGELMKQFAIQIKQLVLAIIALMESTLEKLSSLNIQDIGDQVDDLVGNAVGSVLGDQVGDMVGDKIDDAMDKIGGKFNNFFKKI